MAFFPDYSAPAPDLQSVTTRYKELLARVHDAEDAAACLSAVKDWDTLLRDATEWSSVVQIRFHQDTENAEYKAEKEKLDADWPKFVNLQTQMKEALLASPYRATLEEKVSKQAFDFWQCDADTFDPAIEDDLAEEAKLGSEYTALVGSAQIEFDGKSLTLSELPPYREDKDRSVREKATRARSAWLADKADSFDRIYDDMVKIRTKMAKTMGYDSYTSVGYKNMHRIGYGPDEVTAFRNEVRQEVVPLAVELAEQQAKRIGTDPLMAWDLPFKSPNGNPAPQGDHDWMVERAKEMFEKMGNGLDTFFDSMLDQGLIDLKSRKGKAPGGFCDFLHKFGMPFIYANFNGTQHDVDVFTHEMGHAFQSWSSRNQPLADIVWPTTEACEIHSMALEFLTWPHMDLFYGEDRADELRRLHLSSSLSFLPYGVTVDHFQHQVYDNPDATPDERAAMWQDLEKTYLPWYRYGDLPCESTGRMWQPQSHIFTGPFYYIDYTLALTGALQFWRLSRTDHDEAMERYVALCQRGGSLPYGDLVTSAGFTSPFEPGCLKEVVADAREFLLT